MSRPIAIFGLPQQDFVDRVMKLRRKLLKSGKLEEAESLTLPHLTILINTALDDLVGLDFLAQKLKPLVAAIKPFTLAVTDYEIMESSIILKFDTSFTRKLVGQMSSVLPGFRPVTTDYIKILRKVVPGANDEVLENVKQIFSKEVIIDRVCIAGGTLSRDDLLWTGLLGQQS